MVLELIASALGWLLAAAFLGLAAAAAVDWWRNRDGGRRYLALAIGQLGLTALLAQVGVGRLGNAATIVLFLGAGYALLTFRHHLIPLSRNVRLVATVAGVATAGLAGWQLSGGVPTGFAPLYVVATVLFIGTWCLYVGEPIVRFWRMSRALPAVQRYRLRSLSAGYAGIIAVLLLTFAASAASFSDTVGVGIDVMALLIVPLLAASFAPPAWLRRMWRASEEEAAGRATRQLMLSTPSLEILAERGLEWAARLLGGAGGFVTGAGGEIIAATGMTREEAQALAGALPPSDQPEIVRLPELGAPTLVAVPLLLEGHGGRLVVVAGRFTPMFGGDEVSRLGQYAASLALALERERLGEAARTNALELDRLNRELEVRVFERTLELRQNSRQTQTILESVADAIITIDGSARIASFNRAAEQIFGMAATVAVGLQAVDLLDEGSRADLEQRLTALLDSSTAPSGGHWIETTGLRANGRAFPLELRLNPVESDAGSLVVGCLRDISERQRYLQELEYQALHDALTGLANRALFNDRLGQAVANAQRQSSGLAVLLIDLDHFKEVNDSLGHTAGDTLLQRVADRLTAKIRASDTIARLGGDEFAVVLAAATEADAVGTARKLSGALREPFLIDGRRIYVGASVGIARYPSHAPDAESLLRRADVAMYVAKRRRTGYAVYAPEQDQTDELRLTLQGDLREAIRGGQLVLHYQPIVEMVSGRLTSVEALIRWRHPELGLLGPDRFIPIAEDTELIHELTAWVLREALAAVPQLDGSNPGSLVAINISAHSLGQSELPRQLSQELRRAAVDPGRLRLEVTETAAVTSMDSQVLSRLRDMGVQLAIDDFGTGHSSLTRLRDLPVHEIKIDRSFVTGLGTAGGDPAIVRTTIDLAHRLDLEVVAEGVETVEEWAALRGFGCDHAQGFLIARPMELADLLQWRPPALFTGPALVAEG